MQRIQIARGEIGLRQSALPLLAGEYFLDTSTDTGYQLYVGTGLDGNYEWKSKEILDENNQIIGGPEGAYKKIGTTNPLGFFETQAAHDTPGYLITSLPTEPTTGAVYIAKANINLTPEQAALFENLDNNSSAHVIKNNDILMYTGYKWVKVNNAGGTANESEFYNKQTQAPQSGNAATVQDAIVALDSQKLTYKGVLFNSSNITSSHFLTLATGDKFVFEDRENADDAAPIGTILPGGIQAPLGTVEGTVWLIDTECTINGVQYEQGDFLTVTSNKAWSLRSAVDAEHPNEKVLSNTEVVFTRVPGGTHDPSKLYIDGHDLTRETHGGHVYANDAYDWSITNVKEALEIAFRTKADLDPSTGKLLISQLPSTIVGSMEYQGTYNGGVELVPDADAVTLPDGTRAYDGFTLPTELNKQAQDTDTDIATHDPTTLGVVKGDYWIFASDYKWDITSLVNSHQIEASGLKEVDDKYYLTNGDWIVYNGGGKWSVIDNTDAFIGISDGTTTLQGVVNLKGNKRTEDLIEIETSTEGQNFIISAPQAVLAKDGVAENKIYKSGSATNRTAVESNLTDDGTNLTIVENEGIILTTGGESNPVTATIVGNNNDATLKLPNIDTTLAGNEDLGIVDSNEETVGHDWFATMYRTENQRKVIRDSFLQFFGDEANGQLALKGFTFKDETSANHKVEFRLSSDTGHTIQVLPRLSGYLLNSNSVIDCGVWNQDNPTGYAPTEGYVSESDKIYKNQVGYDYEDDTYYQTEEEADADDLITPLDREIIEAVITNN